MNRLYLLAITVLTLLLLLVLPGCTSREGEVPTTQTYKHVCDDNTVTQRADFIINCVRNANPKSDEEPEDWITLCQTMAEETYCPNKEVLQTHRCDFTGMFGECRHFDYKLIKEEVKQ
ncbi:hypothetical protein THIOSC15_2930020 [uncultured Thiomicrorhabdus sp.]